MTVVVLGIIAAIAALILVHELGHFLVAKARGIRVDEFGIGFPPRIAVWQRGETVYTINALPFGGFVRLYGEERNEGERIPEQERAFFSHGIGTRAAVIVAGVVMNFLAAWMFFSATFMIGLMPAILVSDVVPDSPAHAAGMERGDIVAGYETLNAFLADIDAHAGTPLQFSVQRSGETLSLSATPDATAAPERGALGVSLIETGTPQLGVIASIGEGLRQAVLGVGAILIGITGLLASIVTGSGISEDIVGPIGIVLIAQQAATLGIGYLLQIIGIISLNLAVLNLLPFPALDGGRLLFLVIEYAKGAPLSLRGERMANGIGFAVLVLAMIAITIRDLIGVLTTG